MNTNGGPNPTLPPTHVDRITRELADGYRKIQGILQTDRLREAGAARAVIGGAERAVVDATPTWLATSVTAALRRRSSSLAETSDATEAGFSGLLLFERPINYTTLGAAGPRGVAPVNGLMWWPGSLDDDLSWDDDDPDLVVVHVLSTAVSEQVPWSPSVWADSTLSDLGMFVLPLGTEMSLPCPTDDDLAPSIEVLLGLGAAVRGGRIDFNDVASAQPRADRLSTPVMASLRMPA